MATAGKTPRVQLRLLLCGEEEAQIRQLAVTGGHEVVEARRNGVSFCFKRKRAEPPAAPAASAPRTAARSHLLRTPAAALLAAPAATAVPAGSPYADEVELPRGLGERLAAAAAALPERAPPAQRLLAFAESIGAAAAEAEARRPGGAPRAATLAAAFQGFHAALAGALESGAVALAPRCAPPTPPTSAPGQQEVDQPDYAVDLAARKAGLRARLANFQREEAEWHALLAKVGELDRQQLAGPAAAAAPDAAVEPAACRSTDAAAAAEQQQQLVAEQQQQAAEQRQPGGSGGCGVEGDAELAALQRAHAGLHRRLAMQVEGVCKLVGDVEALVERAARSASSVQAEYHAEKFRVFPHVDSPARLIRELVRPAAPAPGSAAKAAAAAQAAAAAAGGKENAGAEA